MIKKILLLSTALIFTLSAVEAKQIKNGSPPVERRGEENNGSSHLVIRLSPTSPLEEEIHSPQTTSSTIPNNQISTEEEVKLGFLNFLLETTEPNQEINNALKTIILKEVEKSSEVISNSNQPQQTNLLSSLQEELSREKKATLTNDQKVLIKKGCQTVNVKESSENAPNSRIRKRMESDEISENDKKGRREGRG